MKQALVFDIGGTKIAAAIVRSTGDIVTTFKTSTHSELGPEALIHELIQIGKELTKRLSIDAIGISSAGPLDPIKGHLINPTNLKTDGKKNWGLVDLVTPIKDVFQKPTLLENDAAAAAIGEFWMGGLGSTQSILSLTLGTGVGVGAIVEGKLQRCRQGFHPEVSHIPIHAFEKLAPCGCGNLGCIEAFLSGVNFPRYYALKTGKQPFSGKEFLENAIQKDDYALNGFTHYSELMALAINSLAIIYSPEVIVFSGSFSEAFPFFADNTKLHLEHLLKQRRKSVDFLPTLKLSKIKDHAGLLGVARMAFHLPQRY